MTKKKKEKISEFIEINDETRVIFSALNYRNLTEKQKEIFVRILKDYYDFDSKKACDNEVFASEDELISCYNSIIIDLDLSGKFKLPICKFIPKENIKSVSVSVDPNQISMLSINVGSCVTAKVCRISEFESSKLIEFFGYYSFDSILNNGMYADFYQSRFEIELVDANDNIIIKDIIKKMKKKIAVQEVCDTIDLDEWSKD